MVSTYGLDTTFLIDLLKGDLVAKRLGSELINSDLCTTQLNVYELLVGFYSATGKDIGPDIERAKGLLDELNVLSLNEEATQQSAQINGFLSKKGLKIDHLDALIAGILLVHGCTTIITRNVADFKRIPGLKVKAY